MRERTTWPRTEILKRAALNKKADPYTMNQDHKQPSADAYTNGSPSEWAEDVHKPDDWKKEYSGGEVKRNEIGMPELLDKQASFLTKKADTCIRLAEALLGKKASENLLEDQAVAFMELPDTHLIESVARLAQAQDEEQSPAQDDAKQAQQQEESQQAPAQEEKQASPVAPALTQESVSSMVAQALKPMIASIVGQVKKAQEDAQQQQQAAPPAQESKEAAPAAPVAQQEQMDLQAMIQQEVQSQLQQQAPAQQQAAPDQQQEMTADQELDQLLMDEPGQGMGDDMGMGDIQMDPMPMDVGEVGLGPEDDALSMLFANNDEVQQAQQAKQASSVRTASTRTLGLQPTKGVARIGGPVSGSSKVAASQETDKLSSLWNSAPDVREHFGMK